MGPAALIYPVGVWYSVETTRRLSPNPLEIPLARDFARIGKLGFNTVFLKHAAAEDLPMVLSAIKGQRLTVVVSDPVATRYVQTGVRNGSEPAALLAAATIIPHDPAIAGRYVGHVLDEVTGQRAREVALAAGATSPPVRTCVSLDPGYVLEDADAPDYVIAGASARIDQPTDLATPAGLPPRINTVTCLQHRKSEAATVRRWLRDYHLGLLQGYTAGAVFDGYRSLPGNWVGIVGDSPSGDVVSPERTAIIKLISQRAHRWGRLLCGLSVTIVEQPASDQPDLKAGLFADEKRRYLLIVNTSLTHFVRGQVRLPSQLAGRATQRAVGVTPADDRPLGAVYPVEQDELNVPVNLGPGEADLYELF